MAALFQGYVVSVPWQVSFVVLGGVGPAEDKWGRNPLDILSSERLQPRTFPQHVVIHPLFFLKNLSSCVSGHSLSTGDFTKTQAKGFLPRKASSVRSDSRIQAKGSFLRQEDEI